MTLPNIPDVPSHGALPLEKALSEPREGFKRRNAPHSRPATSKSSEKDMNDEELDELLACLVFQMGASSCSRDNKDKASKISCETSSFAGPMTSSETMALQGHQFQNGTAVVSMNGSPAENERKSCLKNSLSCSELGSRQENTCTTQRSASVRFDKVEIRAYPVEPGDNPACKAGPPLTLGWDYVTILRRTVRDFESSRLLMRRDSKRLVIPVYVREKILQESGFSDDEISSSIERIEKDKTRRRETLMNLRKYGRLDGTMEKARNKMRKFLHLRKNDDVVLNELWCRSAADYCDALVTTSTINSMRNRDQRRVGLTNPVA